MRFDAVAVVVAESLHELEEHRADGTGVEVHEVPIGSGRGAVIEQVEAAQPRHIVVVEAESAGQVVVVVVRYGKKFHSGSPGGARQRNDVGTAERDMLGQAHVVKYLRGDIERQPDRAVGGSHHLAADQPGGSGHLGGSVGFQSEDAGQKQHRVLGALPWLDQVDVVDRMHRCCTLRGPALEFADPARCTAPPDSVTQKNSVPSGATAAPNGCSEA